jgi:hypothetical protein
MNTLRFITRHKNDNDVLNECARIIDCELRDKFIALSLNDAKLLKYSNARFINMYTTYKFIDDNNNAIDMHIFDVDIDCDDARIMQRINNYIKKRAKRECDECMKR